MRRMAPIVALLVSTFASLLVSQQSFDGTYRISVEVPAVSAQNAGEETEWNFVVRDSDGQVETRVSRTVPYDVAAPSPVVFENGRVLLVHSFDAYAELYDRSGALLRRIPLMSEPAPDHERVIRTAAHRETALLAIAEEGMGVRVVELTSDGGLRDRRVIDAMTVSGIAVGADPSLVVVGTVAWVAGRPTYRTTFLDKNDAWSVDGGFSKGRFIDPDQFIGISDREVSSVSLSTRAMVWKHAVETGRMLIDATQGSEGLTMLTAERPKWFEGGWIYTDPRTATLDRTGRVITEQRLRPGSFSKGALERMDGKVYVRLDDTIVR